MKVLLIEDDAEIIEFVSLAFEVGWPGCKVISTHHGAEGVEMVEKEAPDIVLLDLGLPDISGFEVIKEIRLFSAVPIIIATVRESEPDIVKGLNLGADEYVAKPFGQMEILARVRAVMRRQQSPEIASQITCGHMQLDTLSDTLTCGSGKVHLTRTESLVMRRLMSRVGNVVSYRELAETVWGETYPNAVDTLRVYVRRLRTKVESVPACQASIRSKPGLGYMLEVAAQQTARR